MADMQHTFWIGSMEKRAKDPMDCALSQIATAVVLTNSDFSVLKCSLWVLHYISFSFLPFVTLVLANLVHIHINNCP